MQAGPKSQRIVPLMAWIRDFFLGKKETSDREGFPAYVADRLTAVKWRTWKMHLIKQETDLKEERDVGAYNTWVAEPMMKIIAEFEASLRKYPRVDAGTPDPYTPPN